MEHYFTQILTSVWLPSEDRLTTGIHRYPLLGQTKTFQF